MQGMTDMSLTRCCLFLIDGAIEAIVSADAGPLEGNISHSPISVVAIKGDSIIDKSNNAVIA